MSATDGPRIGVVGAGAIGGWIAAKLALGGEQVSVLARGDTLRLVRAEGLRLSEKGEEFIAPVEAADDPGALGPQDLLIVAVKATALPGLASELEPLIDGTTLIVPMLNGVPWWFVPGEPLQSVDPDGSIARAFPLDQVIGCVVHASCSRAAPNQVRVNHADKLILGEPAGGEPSDRLALCRNLRSGRSPPRPHRKRAPRDLVQIVGQCDDQSAVGAEPRDLRSSSSPIPNAAPGCSKAWPSLPRSALRSAARSARAAKTGWR